MTKRKKYTIIFKVLIFIIILLHSYGFYTKQLFLKYIANIIFFFFLTLYYLKLKKRSLNSYILFSCLFLFFGYLIFSHTSTYNYVIGLFLISSSYLLKTKTIFNNSENTISKTNFFYFLIFLLLFVFFFMYIFPKDENPLENILDFYFGFNLVICGTISFVVYLKNMTKKNLLLVKGMSSISISNLGFSLFSEGISQVFFILMDNFLFFYGHYFLLFYFVLQKPLLKLKN